MYASFFELRERPFNNTPDPRFFYPTRDHEEALASLIYAVQERKGFVLLTGEVGAGKTLVSRMMLRHFGMHVAFATINHALKNGGDLLESICTEFELPFEPGDTRTQLVRTLHDFLLAKFAQDLPVVLVLDEAQALSVDAFEQVRMIGNLEADDAKLLQVAIVGQPELQQRFASPALRQLSQRIARSFHLPALTPEETEGYIRHRMSVAGARKPDVFQPDAIAKVYEHSKGLPRLINTLCDSAMLSAYSVGTRTIAGPCVESVVEQLIAVGESPGPLSPPPDQPISPPAEPHATYDKLRRLVAAADMLTQRGKQESQELARREARAQELASKMQRLMDDVRRVFGGLRQAVATTEAATHNAQHVCNRLNAQTERSRLIAQQLNHSAARISSTLVDRHTHSANTVKELSRTSAVPRSSLSPVLSNVDPQDRVRMLLRMSRESLADLRTVIRSNHTGNAKQRDGTWSKDPVPSTLPCQTAPAAD
ncbi:MAG: ExeA family protein [Phycisphaerae bacterium]